MTRFVPVLTLLLTLCSASYAQSGDSPPDAPGNPIARVYSPTAAGLRWERSQDDSGPISRYEVLRDGASLGIYSGLSFIDENLRPGRGYNYAIVAIDPAGQRSARAIARAVTPDAPPLKAENIRASTYSATVAEIFWSRSPVFGQRYEIRRNGQVVATSNGTNYLDDTLVAGRRYLFEVISLNRQDQRARSARIFVDTREAGGEPVAPPPPTNTLAAPTGLRADVYSQTAAEVFWTRPTTPGLIYEVRRNGQLLTRTNGTSVFDDSLTAGERYTYEVRATRSGDGRSSPASVSLTTPAGAPTLPEPNDNPFEDPDPNASNVIARLGFSAARTLADDLVSMSYLGSYYDIDSAIGSLMLELETFEELTTLECPGGGTLQVTAATPFNFDIRFEACVIDGRTLSGRQKRDLDYLVFGGGNSQEVSLTFDDFSLDTGDQERLTVSGTSTRRDRSTANPACSGSPTVVRQVENDIGNARLDKPGDSLTVENATWTQTVEVAPRPTGEPQVSPCENVYRIGFRGEVATASSIEFGTRGASVTKSGAIVRDPRDTETSSANARLEADFRDGSSFTVATETERSGEAQVDILVDGVAVSFIDNYRFEAREDFPPILGND